MTDAAPRHTQRPSSVDEITPAWLTEVFRRDGALALGSTVTSVASTQIAVGVGFVSNLYRLDLGYDGDADGHGPASVIVKVPTDSHYRAQAEALGAYIRELTFYRRIAPHAPLPAPHAFLADGANGPDDGGDFLLIIEDLRALEPADHLEGLPWERAERMIDALARFHAWSIGSSAVAETAAVFPAINDPAMAGLYEFGLPTGWEVYQREARQPIPAPMHDLIAGYLAGVQAMVNSLAQPAALTHGDLRVDNLFFDSDGNPSVVDYQFAMRASGIYDVAYLVSQGLPTEVRRGRDREAVERYVTRLAEAGVDGYDVETAWRQYREATVLALTFPLAAISGWDGLGARARELCLVLMERAIATITDTDADQVINR